MFKEILDSLINPKQSIEKNRNINQQSDSSGNLSKIDSRKTIFRLPISYLKKDLYDLNPTVSQDLELLGRPVIFESSGDQSEREAEKIVSASRGMYEYLLNPQHQFALETIPLWNSQYTTDISFLKQTQSIICDLSVYKGEMEKKQFKYSLSCDNLLEIWSATRDDGFFLEKYSYLEWSYLSYLNENPLFLQSISLANIAAPVISFMLPILLLILPFIILKIQGLPIDIEMYVSVLKDIAKHHFIGKAISSMNSLDVQNIAYLIFMGAFYIYSIYQNVITCFRFYRNMEKINRHLHELQFYLDYSLHSMRSFSTMIQGYDRYSEFNGDLRRNFNILLELHKEIGQIKPFTPSIWKVMELGELLRAYYILYSRDDYAEALQYSFGFEGYINNLLGLRENMQLGRISTCSFNDRDSEDINDCSMNKSTVFQNMYYAPHLGIDYIANDCDFSQNIVLTGPNASGKTTYLKSALMNVIFSQQVGMGFYSGGSVNPYTHIHSYLNIPDTSARDSLFQAESRRCKEIIDAIEETPSGRHLCTFDELYSGTNPEEATKSAYAFLNYLDKRENVDFILTTHYIGICEKIEKTDLKNKSNKIGLYKMDAIVNGEYGDITYHYKIGKGISRIRGAMQVLRDMEYPDEILDDIDE
jgi:hypothetical protein